MRNQCMKCKTTTRTLVYIRDWRKRGHHWVCERCERQHMRQHPEMMIPYEITQHNKQLLK